MSLAIRPLNWGIVSFFKKRVLKIAKAKLDNVRYLWISILNLSNINLLNLIIIWYKETQSIS